MERYDAIIVGAGQGGIPLAANLAEAGWSVALVERHHLGGSCVNYGCTPTKAMLASARAAHVARCSADLGVRVGEVEVDMAAVVDRKSSIVESFRGGLQKRVDREGLELVREDARLEGPGRVRAGERILASDRIVLNVGARPVVPEIEGLGEVEWLDSTTVMELREVPDHLLVVGGGYVGCEFAQMFARFGSRVTVAQAADRLLPAEDPEVSAAVEEVFEAEGIRVHPGTLGRAAWPEGPGVALEVDGPDGRAVLEGSRLLLAAGRKPATDGLGIGTVGLEVDDRGAIPVDETLATSVEGIWAMGDVNGRAPFTNVSYADFRVLYENWVNGRSLTTRDRRHVSVVFVDPPVARVGLTEREAREAGLEPAVATKEMRRVARAIETGETNGLIRVLGDPETRRLVGASMVGISADEVIHVFAAVMDAGAGWDALEKGVYAHPAVAEAIPPLVRELDGITYA